jgi:hypothetical protein
LSILKEPRHPLSADLFSNSGVKDLNRATPKGFASPDVFGVVDLADDRCDTVSIAPGFIMDEAQKP